MRYSGLATRYEAHQAVGSGPEDGLPCFTTEEHHLDLAWKPCQSQVRKMALSHHKWLVWECPLMARLQKWATRSWQ